MRIKETQDYSGLQKKKKKKNSKKVYFDICYGKLWRACQINRRRSLIHL